MFCFFGHKAYEILAHQPGVKHESPVLEGEVSTTRLPVKSLPNYFDPALLFVTTDFPLKAIKFDLNCFNFVRYIISPKLCNIYLNGVWLNQTAVIYTYCEMTK